MHTLLLLIIVATTTGCHNDGRPGINGAPETVILLKTTPVKDQGRSSLCWLYAMTAAIETDRLMMGDSVNLSPLYAVRYMLKNQAVDYYMTNGDAYIGSRGVITMAPDLINNSGLTHYDAYHPDANINTLCRKIELAADNAITKKSGIASLTDEISALIDDDMRPAPINVYMYGAEYTPQEFARSVIKPGSYKAFTSFTHHPFGTAFALEIPDNRRGDVYMNVPIDSLQALVDSALLSGRAVCWEGDTSDDGFSFRNGYATLANDGDSITQERRQQDFESFETTDDHCMAIVGMARSADGTLYYICKNSWGDDNPFGGYIYMSANYLRLRTIAIMLLMP